MTVTATPEPKHPVLRDVYWREEILELALWRRGEGFDDVLDADVVATWLGLDRVRAGAYLDRLVTQGYLRRAADGRCALARRGEEEGRRLLHDARVVSLPTFGACGLACWCHLSPIEADRCGAATPPDRGRRSPAEQRLQP